MAVESTPGRSFSDLFKSPRAVEATTGCGPASPSCAVVIMAQRRLDRSLGVGQKIGDAGERLVGFRIEDVQNGADKQRVAGLLPVISAFQRTFGVNENVGDILNITHLGGPASHLQQWIVGA